MKTLLSAVIFLCAVCSASYCEVLRWGAITTSSMTVYGTMTATGYGTFGGIISNGNNYMTSIGLDGASYNNAKLYSSAGSKVVRIAANNVDMVIISSQAVTIAPVSVTPVNPVSGSMSWYVKSSTMVFQYNDGAVVHYLSIPLRGTGTTLTHGTTAP